MAEIPNQVSKLGDYLSTTDIYQIISELSKPNIDNDTFKELIIRLYRITNEIKLSVNKKDTGLYDPNEFNSGNTFSQTGSTLSTQRRTLYRKYINLGSLPLLNKTVAHGITIDSNFKLVHLYGGANNFGINSYVPLPYVSGSGVNNIDVELDATTVIIINNSGIVWTNALVVIEYLKI